MWIIVFIGELDLVYIYLVPNAKNRNERNICIDMKSSVVTIVAITDVIAVFVVLDSITGTSRMLLSLTKRIV